MTTWCTKNYKSIRDGQINVYSNDVIDIKLFWTIGTLRGKTAYIPNVHTSDSVCGRIRGRSTYPYHRANTLFVSPACSISRDVLRNSGFKIKLDPQQAEYVVVDDPPAPMRYAYNLIAYHEQKEAMFIFSLYRDNEEVTEEQVKRVIELAKVEINNDIGDGAITFYYLDGLKKNEAQFLPKCTEWEEMVGSILPPGPAREYVLADRLRLKPSFEISVENLLVLESCSRDIVEKTVLQSNWKEYPMTLAVFLSNEVEAVKYTSSKALKAVLAKIGFYGYNEGETFPDIPVSTQDWEMLQSYILYKLGLKNNGGFVDKEKWVNLKADYKKFILSKAAVAPLKIDSPMSFDNIINSVENSSRNY